MELRRSVHISSSWDASEDICGVLYVANSSGSLLDEPLSAGQCASLTAPTSDPHQPCRLRIDLSDLRGYLPSQIELTTTSRTTELYSLDDTDEEEYIGTVRGTVAGTCSSNEGERKFYSCDHVLPSDGPCRKLSIKLSLRGRSEVLVERIQLVVSADHGGSAVTTQPHRQRGGVDMQELLSGLPVGSTPPFLQTLISSLSQLTTRAGSRRAAVGDAEEEERPSELFQLMDTLRQMRPAVEVVPSCSTIGEDDQVVVENGTESPGEQSQIAASGERDLTDLEARLRRYIDERFEQMEKRLEEKLEQLVLSQLKTPSIPPCTATES